MEVGTLKQRERELTQRLMAMPCVLCGKKVSLRGGLIQRPRDRRPAGVRCAWCYRRYLRKYFPEAV